MRSFSTTESKCSVCGERKVTPRSCDFPLCPRCRLRLNQRHANTLRKFSNGNPNVWVMSFTGPLCFEGWKSTVRRCHRKFGGCYRLDVRPADDSWEHVAIIFGVPDDDVDLVLEHLKSFGELHRFEFLSLLNIDEVLDTNVPSLPDFRPCPGKLGLYVANDFGSRIIHGRRRRSGDLSDLEALAEELSKVEQAWQEDRRAPRAQSGNQLSTSSPAAASPAVKMPQANKKTNVEVKTTLKESNQAKDTKDRSDSTQPERVDNQSEPRPPKLALPRRSGHHGCPGKFEVEGIYQLKSGVLRRISGSGPEEVDPSTVLDPTGELTEQLLEGYRG